MANLTFIQNIGESYRVYSRVDIRGTWKTNTGCSVIKEIDLTEVYKLWADDASTMFGGLSICTVDVIVERESWTSMGHRMGYYRIMPTGTTDSFET
jgi:hypothetical protein